MASSGLFGRFPMVMKGCLLFILACTGLQSGAATISILEQSSYVRLYGQVGSFNDQSQESSSAQYDQELHDDKVVGGKLRLGMSLALDEGNGFGQGIVSQTLSAKDDYVSFSGTADVNINGYSSYPNRVEGFGAALIKTSVHFRLTEPNEVKLLLASSVGNYMDDDFTFVLSSSGKPIWSIVGGDGHGGVGREISEIFQLGAGDYSVQVSLKAASFVSSSTAVAGRSWSNFSISPVPEPNSIEQAMAGLLAATLTMSYRRLRKREHMKVEQLKRALSWVDMHLTNR